MRYRLCRTSFRARLRQGRPKRSSYPVYASRLLQRDADDFLVVLHIDAFVCERGMGPESFTALGSVRRFQNVRGSEHVALLRREFEHDQIALIGHTVDDHAGIDPEDRAAE